MQTATSETESKSLDLSICVHHYTLRAPCPKGQGIRLMSIRPNETILESGGKIARKRTQAAATRAVGVPAHRLAGGMRLAEILPSATFHWSRR